MSEIKTSDLEQILLNSNSTKLPEVIKQLHERDFPSFMRDCFDIHGCTQQEVFTKANLSTAYGYKLLSGEKHTTQRDTIIQICYVANFTLDETQRALKLYGMSPLYVKIQRDALMMNAFTLKPRNILDLNDYLVENNEKPLRILGK